MLSASHVTRTRYAHQIIAAALHILQRRAFMSLPSIASNENEHLDFKRPGNQDSWIFIHSSNFGMKYCVLNSWFLSM